jgi:hypothetical protein
VAIQLAERAMFDTRISFSEPEKFCPVVSSRVPKAIVALLLQTPLADWPLSAPLR